MNNDINVFDGVGTVGDHNSMYFGVIVGTPPVNTFCLSMFKDRVDKDGNVWKDKTYINVITYSDDLAELFAKLRPGDRVHVNGPLVNLLYSRGGKFQQIPAIKASAVNLLARLPRD